MDSSKKICLNPECQKVYTPIEDDDGFCSFTCWEAVNCKFPNKPEFEAFSFIGEISKQA